MGCVTADWFAIYLQCAEIQWCYSQRQNEEYNGSYSDHENPLKANNTVCRDTNSIKKKGYTD